MTPPFALGEYSEFSDWTSSPRAWGPDGTWTASFAGGVVDDLTAGIRSFPGEVSQRYPGKAEARPLAVGCVGWFTSTAVAEALAELGGALIVVNKGASHLSSDVRRILEARSAFLQRALPGLEAMGPLDPDGAAPVIDPYSPMPGDRMIGPFRAAGWREQRRTTPLLHAKLLVLGAWWRWEGDFGEEVEQFTPHKVWMGSANWTNAAASLHLEFGAWSTDPALVASVVGFLEDLVRFSEPIDTGTAGPEPEMVHGTWDDEAFAEAAAEWDEMRGEDSPDEP